MFESIGSYIIKLFFVINPHIVVPFFLSCTQNYTSAERKLVGRKMCLYGLALGVAFALVGNALLNLVGVSVAAFKIGGGVLLGVAAWGLLYSKQETTSEETAPEISMRADISLSPLAFPMFIGPATLTTVVGMMLETKKISTIEPLLVIAALTIIVVLTYSMILCSNLLLKILGRNGALILGKLGGILLIAMSLEMICGGLKIYFN
jgi:multiple antibiotic resistance protein